MKIGNMLAVTSAGQHHRSLSEPLPFRASYPTKQTASFSDRTIKAAVLSHKQHKPTSVHLVQVWIVTAGNIDEKRNKMAAKNAETLIFIRKNMLSKLKGIVNPKLVGDS